MIKPKKPGQSLLTQRLSWLFNCLTLHRHFHNNLLDRCRFIYRQTRSVGILWREHRELARMQHEMVAFRIEEVDIIFRTILRLHDVIQRFPAHFFAAFHDVLDICVRVVRFLATFLRQMRLIFLYQREHRITIDFVASYR